MIKFKKDTNVRRGMKDIDNLVSINELKVQIETSKMFNAFFSKEQRLQIDKIEEGLKNLFEEMSKYIDRFSSIGWCAYDSMSTTLIKKANLSYDDGGIEEAEKVIVNYYKTDIKNNICRLCKGNKYLLMRYDMIQNAFKEHFEERYYASVPLFLIIIDGVVNDFTKDKGFFSEGTDVTAWDCLVGCGDSLQTLKSIFNKSRKKTNTEEIRMPYRNGILHGRDLNYGNEYVSCKCVALLFAVADWIAFKTSEEKRKKKYEKEHKLASLIEIIERSEQIDKDKENINNWKKRYVTVGKDIPEKGNENEYEDYAYIIPIINFLSFWENRNYGELGKILENMFRDADTDKKKAGEARKFFGNKVLKTYRLVEIEEISCRLSKIVVWASWKCNEIEKSANLIFGVSYNILNYDKKDTALPWKNNGKWELEPWDVVGLYQ